LTPVVLKSHPALERRFWFFTCTSFATAYLCTVWAVFFIAKSDDPKIMRGYLTLGLGFLGAALIFGAARLAYVPRAFLKVSLAEGGFVYDRDGRFLEISFARVKGVAIRSFLGFGRRFSILLDDGRRINISLAVQGLENLARRLLEAQPSLVGADQAEELLRRVRLAEFGTARAYDPAPGGFVFFLFKYLVFPSFLGVLIPAAIKCLYEANLPRALWYYPAELILQPLLIIVALTGVVGWLLAFIHEKLTARRERGLKLIDLSRDLAFEERTRSVFSWLYFGGGTVFFVVSFIRFNKLL